MEGASQQHWTDWRCQKTVDMTVPWATGCLVLSRVLLNRRTTATRRGFVAEISRSEASKADSRVSSGPVVVVWTPPFSRVSLVRGPVGEPSSYFRTSS